MALIPDEYWYRQIVNHLRKCDVAFDAAEYYDLDNGQVNASRIEQIAGDVQRTIRTTDPLRVEDD